MARYHYLCAPVFFVLLRVLRSGSRAALGRVGTGSVRLVVKVFSEPYLRLCALRSAPFRSSGAVSGGHSWSTPPLASVLCVWQAANRSAGKRHRQGGRKFSPPFRLLPQRQAGGHWLESGAARQGRSMNIDPRWPRRGGFGNQKRNKAMCCIRFSFTLYNCSRTCKSFEQHDTRVMLV